VEEIPLRYGRISALAAGYCLVVFEIERPAKPLLETFQEWHDEAPGTTLLVVGRRTTLSNRLAVLETGVAAYLSKPIAVQELTARVRVALRFFRQHDRRSRQYPFGSGTIDWDALAISAAGQHVRLTRTECNILRYLALHVNQTVPFGDLVRTLWGTDPQKGVHSLRLFIRKLRQKLEPDPARPIYILTEPTIGYRLQAPANGASASTPS